MLSKIPIELNKIGKEEINKEVLRVAIIAELDAINLYEELAAITRDTKIKEVFIDVANEEKTHVGEFLALLLKYDEKQVKELEKGKKEVDDILGGD